MSSFLLYEKGKMTTFPVSFLREDKRCKGDAKNGMFN